MMWLGIGICVWAIVVLGGYFRGVVSLEPGRRVVESGPYRLVRHPRVHWWLVGAGCYALTTGDLPAVPCHGRASRDWHFAAHSR
ncbi:MAG: hypothetical protein JOZ65_33055 [Chloroflexi bacterium]|nr:hypothetical protein [Chloroflexota bacterium]